MSNIKHSPAASDATAVAIGWDAAVPGDKLSKSESQSEVLTLDQFSDAEQRALVRKADLRLILPMTFGFAMSLLDRVNLGAAYVAGAGYKLRLYKDNRYTLVLIAFFIPYVCFEIPAALLFRRVGARLWLSGLCFCWGCVMIGQGFVTTYQQLAVTRALTGLFEAGFLPCAIWTISGFYNRREIGKRMSFFYLGSVLMAAFSSILAAAFHKTPATGRIQGWGWIFVWSGLLTVLSAVPILLFTSDLHRAPWLSKREKELVLARTVAERGEAAADPLTLAKAGKYLLDPILWGYSLLFLCAAMPTYALAYFLTIIIRDLGYKGDKALLMSAPPFVCACAFAFTASFLADHLNKRGIFVMLGNAITMAGMVMLKVGDSNVKYGGTFLAVMGSSVGVTAALAFQGSNCPAPSKKGLASALLVMGGACGGIIASTTYRAADAPAYTVGLNVTLALQSLSITVTGLMMFVFRRRNALAHDAGRVFESTAGFTYTL